MNAPSILKRATTHDFRHNQASWLAAGGTSTPLLQRVLGHATPAMGARYIHLDVDPVRAVMVRNENAMIALMKEPVPELALRASGEQRAPQRQDRNEL